MCPLDFNNFVFRQHILKMHNEPLAVNMKENVSWNAVANCTLGDVVTGCECNEDEIQQLPDLSYLNILEGSVDEKGVFHDAALFVARLRSNPKLSLSVINDIVQDVQEFLTPAISALKHEFQTLVKSNCVTKEAASNAFRVLDVIENPFFG